MQCSLQPVERPIVQVELSPGAAARLGSFLIA